MPSSLAGEAPTTNGLARNTNCRSHFGVDPPRDEKVDGILLLHRCPFTSRQLLGLRKTFKLMSAFKSARSPVRYGREAAQNCEETGSPAKTRAG